MGAEGPAYTRLLASSPLLLCISPSKPQEHDDMTAAGLAGRTAHHIYHGTRAPPEASAHCFREKATSQVGGDGAGLGRLRGSPPKTYLT